MEFHVLFHPNEGKRLPKIDELFVLLAQPRQIGPQELDPLDRLFHAAVTARLQAQRCINGFQRRIEARPACFSLLVHLHLREVGCLPSYRQNPKVQGMENGKGILAKAPMRRSAVRARAEARVATHAVRVGQGK